MRSEKSTAPEINDIHRKLAVKAQEYLELVKDNNVWVLHLLGCPALGRNRNGVCNPHIGPIRVQERLDGLGRVARRRNEPLARDRRSRNKSLPLKQRGLTYVWHRPMWRLNVSSRPSLLLRTCFSPLNISRGRASLNWEWLVGLVA
jgi:hypothetical protein